MDQSPSAFVCPMHPGVRRLGPGNCPKCGAELSERVLRSSLFQSFSRSLHIVVTLALMLVVLAVGLWWMR